MGKHSHSASVGPARPLWIALFDALSVAAFSLVWGALAIRLAQAVGPGLAALAAGVALLPGYLLADAVSGLVHWFADSFLEEDAPVLGPLLIGPFREHHRDAQGITHHGFLEVCGNNCAACLLLLLPLWAATGPERLSGSLAAVALALLLVTTFFVSATNGFHRWAHMARVPAWVAWLQQHRLILSPAEHALHHCGAHDRAYCVTSGWLNPLLDTTGILRRVRALTDRRGNRG